mmetsp:Transcript_7390/g.11275  ORF Transcript_7390/g.11275 Transcript_7390/m.11275 type:complete len:84 (+) Transcript_7390:3257-3508(+)
MRPSWLQNLPNHHRSPSSQKKPPAVRSRNLIFKFSLAQQQTPDSRVLFMVTTTIFGNLLRWIFRHPIVGGYPVLTNQLPLTII